MKAVRWFVSLLTVLVIAGLTAGVSANQETTVTVSFHPDQLRIDQIGGYDRVTLAEGHMVCQPGQPMLPARRIHVALPRGAQAAGIEVRSLNSSRIPGSYRIFPGQLPARLDGSPPPDFVSPDAATYQSSGPYPGTLAVLEGQTDLAGQQMAVVTVSPLQYVPSAQQLTLHRELQISVQTKPGRVSVEGYTIFTEKQHRTYQEMIAGMVVNPDDVVLDPPGRELSKALPAGQFDHVVITTVGFTPYVADLVEWHNRRGLRDTVVHVGTIYTEYSGADNPEKIRNFIIDAHGTWGTMYFLIAGENGAVPFKERYYYYEDTPSDHYYSDYDDDWTCEVYVGRITGGDSTQYACAIDKILKYEKDPPLTNYPLDILLVGMDLDASTQSEDLKETIDGIIPARFDVTKVYDSHGGNHKDNTVAALDDGQNFWNHSDHSNSTVLGLGDFNHGWFIGNVGVNNLVNDDRTTNIVSTGCYANDMTYGGIQDGVAEQFIIYNPQQAGVSFTGNTRDGWYYQGAPEYLSGELDREWWRSLFNYDKYILGLTLADCKNRTPPSSNIERHCVWTFILQGEPAMPLWTDTPTSMTATHPGSLPLGSSSFMVYVESGGSPVISAYVCLWKEGEVYLTGTTNASGNVTFSPSPSSSGTMYVTATKKNYLPYEGQAAVTGDAPSPVDDLAVAPANGDIVLSWSAPAAKTVDRYVIYRDTDSAFEPGPEDSIGGTADTSYVDAGAAGMVGTNYYYVVKAVDGAGQKSDPSGTVGEYDVELLGEARR
jgi:hypothetical protein